MNIFFKKKSQNLLDLFLKIEATRTHPERGFTSDEHFFQKKEPKEFLPLPHQPNSI
jgi:hypothetical protein